jgi:hypothetical protein
MTPEERPQTVFLAEIRTVRHYRANTRKRRAAQFVNNFETCFVTAETAMEALLQVRTDRGLDDGDVQIVGDLDTIDTAIVACQSRFNTQLQELKQTEARIGVWQRRRQRMLAELKEIG